LPDFSFYIVPKWEKHTKLTTTYTKQTTKYAKLATKYTKRPLNTPNGLKIPNGHKIYQNVRLQAFKSIPKSGNPGPDNVHIGFRLDAIIPRNKVPRLAANKIKIKLTILKTDILKNQRLISQIRLRFLCVICIFWL
jgi:hypothetical protein